MNGTNEHVRTLISNAIEVLEEQGWTQHTMVNARDEVCTLGALSVATRMGYLSDPTVEWRSVESKAVRLVGRELADVLGREPVAEHKIVNIPNLNDRSETTQEHVMLSLKRALHNADRED